MKILKNKNGFTLVELLVTLVILALVVGLALNTINFDIEKASEKTEEVFVDTLRDAIDLFMSTDLKNSFITKKVECGNSLTKTRGDVKVYEILKDDNTGFKFNDIIDSNYHALTIDEFVNPANDDVDCNLDANIKIYLDDDYIYYYYVDKDSLNCLLNNHTKVRETLDDGTKIYYSNYISNFPEGYKCN